MSDLIDRQAAIDALMNDVTPYGLMDDEGNIESGCKDKDVVAMLYNLPSAQPERKKGEWKRNITAERDAQLIFTKVYNCSECGYESVGNNLKNFCPHCGAEMRGENND